MSETLEVTELEGCQDPLSQANKHVLLKNGTFEFDDIPNAKCLCGHSISEHLIDLDSIADCCLYTKDKDLCICDKFVDEDVKVVPKGKLPKKQVLEDPRLNSYVQMMSRL
ncbi:MAG: hypothetical protein WA364_11970 [Candidatus Nitrosopolaris sp.]